MGAAVTPVDINDVPIGTSGNPIYANTTDTPAAGPATAATATVASSATAVTILAASAARRGATVTNDSTAIMYLLLGAGTVSTSVYTVQIGGTGGGTPGYYEVPYGFTGILTALWASATGNARVTSFSA